jgi:hypothetical protein
LRSFDDIDEQLGPLLEVVMKRPGRRIRIRATSASGLGVADSGQIDRRLTAHRQEHLTLPSRRLHLIPAVAKIADQPTQHGNDQHRGNQYQTKSLDGICDDVPGDLADGIGRIRLVHIRYGRVQLVAGARITRVGVD